eukprot:2847687-Pyramimonas_sp.AAC.1
MATDGFNLNFEQIVANVECAMRDAQLGWAPPPLAEDDLIFSSDSDQRNHHASVSFVDDLTVSGGAQDPADLEGAAEMALDFIVRDCSAFGLQVNASKTVILLRYAGKCSRAPKVEFFNRS